MSGDWIKVESATPDKPEVIRLAQILNIPRAHAFGALVIFWCWIDRNAVDGVVDGVDDYIVDSVVALPGFCAALKTVKWVDVERLPDSVSGTLTVPHFDRLNSQSARSRALKNARQARWRANAKNSPKEHAESAEKAPKKKGNGKSDLKPLPEDWVPSEQTIVRLAARYKFNNGDAERYLSYFRDQCAAKGYQYKDFDAAFSNCVRSDWPKFRDGAETMPRHNNPNQPTW
jgi:hypothetical protein